MNKKITRLVALLVILSLIPVTGAAKKKSKKAKPAYVFTIDKELPRTPVKHQYRTGTCWVFSALSYLESEVLRKGGEEVDLSEMFVVRHTYPRKAVNYVRLHGAANFGQGGQFHDVLDQIRDHGIVPESIYPGLNIEEKRHNHGEMSAVLRGILDAVLKRRGRKITPRWLEAFEAVLDVYLGKSPETFDYKGKTYTPRGFVKDYLKIDSNDYIEITSYSHVPFYEQFRLEVPDNWTYNGDYYNVPIDELESIVAYAIDNGHTVAWDADVSEKTFSPEGKEDLENWDRPGYAIIPEKDEEDMTRAEKKKKYTGPVKEKNVSQEIRQKAFDNFTTTDDHLMHIVGLAHDQAGTRFYLVKNSWGTDMRFKGYQYISSAYYRLKTICVMVHKDALSPDMKGKLGIK